MEMKQCLYSITNSSYYLSLPFTSKSSINVQKFDVWDKGEHKTKRNKKMKNVSFERYDRNEQAE